MSEGTNSIGTGNDIVSELSNLDFSKIAMNDVISYITQFGKNVLVALVVYFVGRFIIKYNYETDSVTVMTQNESDSSVDYRKEMSTTGHSKIYWPQKPNDGV